MSKEGRLRGSSPFLPVLALQNGHGFDHDLRYWPRNLHWTAVGFDGAVILAIDQFTFDKDVIPGLNLGSIVSGWPIGNAGMPLGLLLPSASGVFVSLGGRDR